MTQIDAQYYLCHHQMMSLLCTTDWQVVRYTDRQAGVETRQQSARRGGVRGGRKAVGEEGEMADPTRPGAARSCRASFPAPSDGAPWTGGRGR